MLDTFAELREEAGTRDDILTNQCFVCGLTRASYDDVGILSPSFDQHKEEDHDLWNYVYFLSYLRSKDSTEYSGVESYVDDMLNKQDLGWVPSRTSFAIQNSKVSILDEDDIEGHIGEMIDEAVGSLTKSIGAIASRLENLESKMDA
mmetsp:Transcript_64744/g.179894  ORF Transcript_64744/g.179894 Transcript_64744/m.179894 type:complete len:147 (-) Transcript_64744:479-919(-)